MFTGRMKCLFMHLPVFSQRVDFIYIDYMYYIYNLLPVLADCLKADEFNF